MSENLVKELNLIQEKIWVCKTILAEEVCTQTFDLDDMYWTLKFISRDCDYQVEECEALLLESMRDQPMSTVENFILACHLIGHRFLRELPENIDRENHVFRTVIEEMALIFFAMMLAHRYMKMEGVPDSITTMVIEAKVWVRDHGGDGKEIQELTFALVDELYHYFNSTAVLS